jgi:hypothetical protein
LSKSERQRRAREIIAQSGADTAEYFNKVVQPQKVGVVTFKEQASRWIEHTYEPGNANLLHPEQSRIGSAR